MWNGVKMCGKCQHVRSCYDLREMCTTSPKSRNTSHCYFTCKVSSLSHYHGGVTKKFFQKVFKTTRLKTRKDEGFRQGKLSPLYLWNDFTGDREYPENMVFSNVGRHLCDSPTHYYHSPQRVTILSWCVYGHHTHGETIPVCPCEDNTSCGQYQKYFSNNHARNVGWSERCHIHWLMCIGTSDQ